VDDSAPVVVTGAAGFIGRALVERLARRGTPVVALVRAPVALGARVAVRAVGTLGPGSDWPALLAGARAVVHLASGAHAAVADEPEWIEREAGAAAALAGAAAGVGLARIVLMSSIKVLGEATPSLPFRAHQPPAPEDAYGFAKWRMEEAMRARAGDRLVILRPPLVYGPGVKANFRSLIRLVASGLPLPFAAIDNRRSLVFLDNLLDLVELALVHPGAAGESFLLRDNEDVSTPELVRRLARALGMKPRLFPLPPAVLRAAAALFGRAAAAERLSGSLRVDDLATRQRLGWRPGVALDDALALTCRAWRAERAR
jgi:nucleoside-diphosphate-sugar epimerase